jgi:hypothetical protein
MNAHFSTIPKSIISIVFVLAPAIAGCAGRPSLLPNIDPALRKTSTEFAVDSAKRFPYKSGAPAGGDVVGRAQVGYMVKRLEIVDNSPDTWNNVEVWINQQFVVFVPKMAPHDLKELPFTMFYNDNGEYFPGEHPKPGETLIHKVEIYMDGKMYSVPLQLAD